MKKINELLDAAVSVCRDANEKHYLETFYGIQAVRTYVGDLDRSSGMLKDYFEKPYFILLYFNLSAAISSLVYNREMYLTSNWKTADKAATAAIKEFDSKVQGSIWPEVFMSEFENDKKGKKKK